MSIQSLPIIDAWIAFSPTANGATLATANQQSLPDITRDVSAAVGNGTTITYTCTNSFSAGNVVTVYGFGVTSGSSLNVTRATIASATSTQFTVTSSLVGTASGSGHAAVSNSYWTWVGQYVRDFTTKSGKQHYLDRVEATTLKLTVNNRDGFFNGSPYTITPRMPVAIKARWVGQAYPIFFGIIDSITENPVDELNSDLDIEASDLLKYLSLKYLLRPSFWKQYTTPANQGGLAASARYWYRCSNYAVATVTAAQANSSAGTVTYQIVNASTNFNVGSNVTVNGLAGLSTLNVTNAAITATTVSNGVVTSFTVALTTTGNPSATSAGVAYITALHEYIASNDGYFLGQVSYPQHGALIYDTDGCVDLSGQGNVASGTLNIVPTFGTQSTYGAIDFWILGQQVNGNTLLVTQYGSGAGTVSLFVNPNGYISIAVNGSTVSISGEPKVNDGYWHHVGLVVVGSGSTGTINLYCDGQFFPTSLTGTSLNFVTGGLYVGATATQVASYNGYVDEIVVSNLSSLSTLVSEVQQRYRAGTLLQLGYPVTSTKVLSGDRIAELLTLAGMGTISGGTTSALATVSIPSGGTYGFYIGNSYQTFSAFSAGASTNGAMATEPYYWDSPVDGSTALDLIQQVTDTDIGAFYQDPAGRFYFNDQNYYGTWTFTNALPPGTPSFSWTYNYSVGNVLSDDNTTGSYPYDVNNLQVIQDDADLWTTVRITPQAGVDQIYENVQNEARWGYSTLSKSSTLSTSLQDALSSAWFLGYIYKTPLARVNNVTLLSETTDGTNQGTNLPFMLSVALGDVVQFKRTQPHATSNGVINLPMAVESISHEFAAEPGYWHTSLILDPYPVRQS